MPHAFITGAAKRVGRHIALALAEAGYDITLHYYQSITDAEHTRNAIKAIGQECSILRTDLTKTDQLQSIIYQAKEELGAIDILIHNASIFEKDTLHNMTAESFMQHIQVNLAAPALLTSAYQQSMPEGKEGHVICLCDGMTGWSISSEFMSYALSKLGLEQFITLSAPALAPHIRINGIALGATLQGHMDKEETFDKTKRLTPLKRNSCPQEVVTTLMMLLASPSITGQIIRLNGGMHLPSNHVLQIGL